MRNGREAPLSAKHTHTCACICTCEYACIHTYPHTYAAQENPDYEMRNGGEAAPSARTGTDEATKVRLLQE